MTEKTTLTERLHLGSAYYPEHWPEERWPEDIRLMQAAGLTVARLAEFAWSTMEPVAGQFHFAWLDRAIEQLAAAGLVTVLGTPTAAPPAWLVQQQPGVLAITESGFPVQFGNRCHYCVNSPEFHSAVASLVGAMAAHFGPNPNVIGWQIDNEYNRVCYCEHCRRLFQQFLAERYSSLDHLNQRWSTSYWSQTYTAWEQIPIPIGPHNPGLMLEFKRFVTASYRRFQQLQIDLLRPHLPQNVWITHNFMGWYDGFDHYELAADLDMASWDWYIGSGHNDPLRTGAIHDLTRGFKRRNFWVMETQPGHVNWSPLNNALNKGEARAMAWQAVAHGANAILYWQWRSALGGQEQYHGALVNQSGSPRAFYSEVQQIGLSFAALSEQLAGSTVESRVAMLNDYESRWSIQWQRHHRDFDYVEHFNHYYRPLAALNVPVDILSALSLTSAGQLQGYRLVILPALVLATRQLADVLRDFVAHGGHLVLTTRTGLKDEYNALHPVRQPGPFSDLAGVEVEEYYALLDPVPVKGNWFEGNSQIWAERLRLVGEKKAQVIATYGKSNGWLDDQIAITVISRDNGLVYYVGAYLDGQAQQDLLARFLRTAGIKTIKAPGGVSIRARTRPDGSQIYIVVNHQDKAQSLVLPWPAIKQPSGEPLTGEFMMQAYGVLVLTQQT